MTDTTASGRAASVEENTFEAWARGLSEFVIRVAMLPVTLLLAKPRHIANAHITGSYRPLPSPFLLAFVTGVAISGVVAGMASVDIFSLSTAATQTLMFNAAVEFYRTALGGNGFLVALPYIGLIWLAAGLLSGAMWRGDRSPAPVFAGFAYCLAAIVEIAAVGVLVGLLPFESELGANIAFWIVLGLSLIYAIKLIRLLFVLRKENNSSFIGATVASIPALLIVLIAGVIGGIVSMIFIATSASAQDSRNDGDMYLQQGQYDRAVSSYTEALGYDQQDPTVYFSRGMAYLNLSRGSADEGSLTAYEQLALEDFAAAISLNSDYLDAYSVRGYLYYERAYRNDNTDDYARSLADYDQIIRLTPEYAEAYNMRCWIRGITGSELDQALRDCNQGLELDPSNVNILDSRGFVHLRRNEWAAAVEDYSAGLAIDPQHVESLYGRGIARLRLNDAATGQADIQAALALDPGVADRFQKYGIASATAPPPPPAPRR